MPITSGMQAIRRTRRMHSAIQCILSRRSRILHHRSALVMPLSTNRELTLQPLSALEEATTSSSSHYLATVVAAILAGVSLLSPLSSSSKCEEETGKKLRKCGEWCATAPGETPCRMDATIVPCKGDKYCQTTAGLWSLFALGPKTKPRPVSCELYKAGLVYPVGSVPCDPACWTPEFNPKRHPAPTGLGVFCRPGMCSPGAMPNPECGKGLGTLQCPCNWFGSECPNDWVPVRILEKSTFGGWQQITLQMDVDEWETVVQDYRPGSMVRLHHLKGGTLYEMACPVASYQTPGHLEILVAPPDPALHPQARHVAELLRRKVAVVDNLYVNPVISGFTNGRHTYLMNSIQHSNNKKVQDLVLLSTGTDIAAVLPTLEAVVARNKKNADHPVRVHLYHGVRNLQNLPYLDRLEELVQTGMVELTLIQSRPRGSNATNAIISTHPGVHAALHRGETVRRHAESTVILAQKKIYVQDIFQHDLQSKSLKNMAVVVSGRSELIDSVRNLLLLKCREECREEKENNQWMKERLFLNIRPR
jgi:hypothetical protein